ncbi:MAG TPA: hypothetical protein VFE51_15460 [Verrucomicrobiae bacterium]|nr:hypothetical protein [Verrucomicrobiae bacterium]
MDLSTVKSMEQLADYVRNFVNPQGIAAGLWDFDGVVNLLGALLDNVRDHAVVEDVEALSRLLTPRQAVTLLHIARAVQQYYKSENPKQR